MHTKTLKIWERGKKIHEAFSDLEVTLGREATIRNNNVEKRKECRAWWRTPLIPALGRQRLVDL